MQFLILHVGGSSQLGGPRNLTFVLMQLYVERFMPSNVGGPRHREFANQLQSIRFVDVDLSGDEGLWLSHRVDVESFADVGRNRECAFAGVLSHCELC